ncbi:MAG TPA: serine hydrolase [Candidatus Eisenbacteria bacterium]|nr:serine hydrolase [Candidatus Eisenbacteria bacterium]
MLVKPSRSTAIRFALILLIASLLTICVAAKSPTKAASTSGRLQRVEETAFDLPGKPGEAPIRLNLAELMKTFNVPGLSVAIIENYKIVDAKAYGVIEPGSSTPVTTKTLFQAGSISKPVAATGAMYLVQQGKLSLDGDVNQKLKTWKVPENDFTKTEKVTLRRIMSHTAGLTVHGFPGYDVDAPRPTIVQVLNGEKPANTDPIRVDTVPGTNERYSGGGVTIEQLLMMDVTGKQFPALMRELVLDKIGMSDSSYEQPLPTARAAMTAGGAYADGKPVHGKWHIYPEMAAAGLWTTPTDLAKFAIEIALSKQAKANHILSPKTTQEMLTPVMDEAGLGFFFEKDNPGQFGHNGADEGFQALLTMNAETGNGIAMMADSDNGISVMNQVLRRVAAEYGWNYKMQADTGADLFIISKLKGAAAAIEEYDLLKSQDSSKVNEATLNELGYRLLYGDKEMDSIEVFKKNVELYPQSGNVYDSLGEAYAKVGQKDLAIQNYEKSLRLNPKNNNAIEQLKKLKGDGGEAMGEQNSEPKIVQQDGFTVVGISARTTNANEMTAQAVIGPMWGRLFQEGVIDKIPNKTDRKIVAVYTDYSSDHNGEYTYVLGARVSSDKDVPAGMVTRKLPGGKYAMFTSEKGPGPKVVPALWMKINSLPRNAVGADRVYGADFEIYDQRAVDPQNLQMDVYVGIK